MKTWDKSERENRERKKEKWDEMWIWFASERSYIEEWKRKKNEDMDKERRKQLDRKREGTWEKRKDRDW